MQKVDCFRNKKGDYIGSTGGLPNDNSLLSTLSKIDSMQSYSDIGANYTNDKIEKVLLRDIKNSFFINYKNENDLVKELRTITGTGGLAESVWHFAKNVVGYMQQNPIESWINQYKNSFFTQDENDKLNALYTDLNRKIKQEDSRLKSSIDPLNAKIKKLDSLIEDINENKIPAEQKRGEKNTIIAEVLFKRIIQIHHEVVKRSYEGLFINASLQEMRETMTNVLQEGTDTAIVPNFCSKCTNYYTNPLIEPLFKSEITAINEEKERFNIIHQILFLNKTDARPENKKEIIQLLGKKGKSIVYCVCLLINNTYKDSNGTLNQNPPKIPYIDLTEGFTELTRFKKETAKPDVKNLVFRQLTYEKNERSKDFEDDNKLIDENLQKIIQSITGYSYKNFTNKLLHFSIFENIHNYLLYCYRMSCYARDGEYDEISEKTYNGNGNKSIAQSKIKEINDKFNTLEKVTK